MLSLEEISLDGDLKKKFTEGRFATNDGNYPRFLCKYKWRLFVSSISLLRREEADRTMPPNCEEGCLYVNPPGKNPVIPINELTAIYYIVGGDYYE